MNKYLLTGILLAAVVVALVLRKETAPAAQSVISETRDSTQPATSPVSPSASHVLPDQLAQKPADPPPSMPDQSHVSAPAVMTANSISTTPVHRQQATISARPQASTTKSPPGITSLPAAPASVAQGTTEEVIPVPIGARLPAALVDPAPSATAAQATALDNLGDEFLNTSAPDLTTAKNISAAGPGTSSDEGNWISAAAEANERYRALFGVEAFNAWSTAAAKEALAEKP